MEEVLSTCCECILSAISHKVNVSGHMLMCTFFLVLVYGNRAQSLSAPFSYNENNDVFRSHSLQKREDSCAEQFGEEMFLKASA
jgi:hypothetical protein